MKERQAGRKRSWRRWGVALAVAAVIVAVGAAAAGYRARRCDPSALVGRWERPDGGYVLDIRTVRGDGGLEAAYLNPRPIRVSQAKYRAEDGELSVFVELRDVFYPGSTYRLRYEPKTDRLAGRYFQALQGQLFDVEFVRLGKRDAGGI